jgi:hypothetical protein
MLQSGPQDEVHNRTSITSYIQLKFRDSNGVGVGGGGGWTGDLEENQR